MARRPAAEKNPPDLPLTLQKAFEAGFSAPGEGETSSGEDPAEARVGEHLRELRQERNLSVRALAARSGLAINTLSMIENGRTSPSVSTLQILARALEVPIAAFFAYETIEKKVVHARSQQRPAAMVETTRLEHLGKGLAGGAVQPFVVTLEPGFGSGQSLTVHTGHEFVYCLSGQVQYTIEGQNYLLEAGDSLIFESHLPHCWKNAGNKPAQIILVLIPADSRDTPAERHFLFDQINPRRYTMKIALITDDGQTISQHFGRARYYLVMTIEDGQVVQREMRDKLGHHHFSSQEQGEHQAGEQHGFDPAAQNRHASMAQSIADCQVIICGGMGAGAYESMRQYNIRPVVTDLRKIDEALQAYLAGSLQDRTDLLH